MQVLFVELLAPAEAAVYLRPKERKIYEVAGDAVPCTKMTGALALSKGRTRAAGTVRFVS